MKCKNLIFDKLLSVSLTLLFLSISANAFGQIVYEGAQIKKLNLTGFNVKLSPKGDKLLYSDANFRGLKLYDIEKQKVMKISDEPGAGYNAILTNDLIYFKPKDANKFIAVSSDNNKVVVLDISQNEQKQLELQRAGNALNVTAKPSSDLTGIIVKIGQAAPKLITPIGQNDYLNVSVSPDGSKLLFRVSGIASYATTLDGEVIKKFEDAEFPTWLNNEEILYAIVKDDGHNYLASDLFVEALKSDKKINLTTNSKVIALYPTAAAGKVAFNTPQGAIYLIEPEK